MMFMKCFNFVGLAIGLLGIVVLKEQIKHLKILFSRDDNNCLKLLIYNQCENVKMVKSVFKSLEYEEVNGMHLNWDILWSDESVFKTTDFDFKHLKQHQKINHVPGIHFMTNKLPPESTKIDNLKHEIVIDEHTFDIGVYVLISSFNPLRIYRYKIEVLSKFCCAKKDSNCETHVPVWEIPSLAHYVKKLGYSSKSAIEVNLTSRGYNTSRLWDKIDDSIVSLILSNENHFISEAKNFETVHNFFENLRFDFRVDDKLNVNLMRVVTDESIKGKLDHDLIVYKKVLYNTLKLIGASSFAEMKPRSKEESNMISTKRDIAVDAPFCSTTCLESCDLAVCDVCLPCVTNHDKFRDLHRSYREHMQQGEMKRIFPSSVHFQDEFIKNMTQKNQFMIKWFQAKCYSDVTWC